MAALRLGEAVRTADSSYPPIYLWSHDVVAAVAPFVAVTTTTITGDAPTDGGGASCTDDVPPPRPAVPILPVRAGHLLPTDGGGAPCSPPP